MSSRRQREEDPARRRNAAHREALRRIEDEQRLRRACEECGQQAVGRRLCYWHGKRRGLW